MPLSLPSLEVNLLPKSTSLCSKSLLLQSLTYHLSTQRQDNRIWSRLGYRGDPVSNSTPLPHKKTSSPALMADVSHSLNLIVTVKGLASKFYTLAALWVPLLCSDTQFLQMKYLLQQSCSQCSPPISKTQIMSRMGYNYCLVPLFFLLLCMVSDIIVFISVISPFILFSPNLSLTQETLFH